MTFNRGQLTGEVLELLQKSPTSGGLITPAKVVSALQDSLDFIATKMMKVGGGWLTRKVYLSVTANSPYVTLPPGLAIVNFVKFQPYGSAQFVPISFNDNADGATDVSRSGVQGTLPMWSFSNGKMYLEPYIDVELPDAILIDGVFYPDWSGNDGTVNNSDMDNRAFVQYAKWRSATMLRALTTKDPPPWAMYEQEWKQAALELIARRVREPGVIRALGLW